MAGVRIVVTPLAAESGMPYLRYVAFDVLGAGLWCSLWVLVGFVLGDQWMRAQGNGKELMLGVLGAGLLLTLPSPSPSAWLARGVRRQSPMTPDEISTTTGPSVWLSAARPRGGGHAMMYILMWLLGVPATLLIILFLLGVGR